MPTDRSALLAGDLWLPPARNEPLGLADAMPGEGA